MLSQSVGYAASALGAIAMAKGKPVLIKEIAKEGGIPIAYLGKLINTLARKGVVQTQRGIGGGVTLIPAADQLSLYDVCVIFDEPVTKQRCMLSTAECSDERACPCHHFWTAHRAAFVTFLKKTTIADMASFETKESLKRLSNGLRKKSRRM